MTNSGEIMASPRSIKSLDVIASPAAHDANDEPAFLDFPTVIGAADLWRPDSCRNLDRLSTLIRHAAELQLPPSPLAIPVIEPSFLALLMFSVGLLALQTARFLSAGIVAVAVPAVAAAANVEHSTAAWASTESLSINCIGGLAHPDLTRGLDKSRFLVRGLHHLHKGGVVAYSNHRHLDLSRSNGWGPSLLHSEMNGALPQRAKARMMLME